MTQEFIKAFNEANESALEKQAGGLRAKLMHKFSMFHRKEDGSLIIFGMYMFICMMIITGMAVDFMRAEHQRTRIQATTDRALLAAASINQTLAAQDIFDDYFAKAGMEGAAPTAVVEENMHYRKVSAAYAVGDEPTIKTMFISEAFRNLLEVDAADEAGGINELSTFASGIAVDGVSDVEISLVLDVSGSMRGSKLTALQGAAHEFFESLLLDRPNPDTYSISIIPYSTQVSAGANLLSKYNASSEHAYSHCVDFVGDDFDSAALSTSDQLQRTGHFHPFNNPYKNKDKRISWENRSCAPKATREILPLSGDINELKSYVDAFEASGNTSTDVGMKWGVALLDPSARPVVSALVNDGDIDPMFNGRPFSYIETNTSKVMVVMTDGANTQQYYLKPEVSGGYPDPDDNMSNVWHRTGYDRRGRPVHRYVVFNPNRWGANKFYHVYTSTWKSAPDDSDYEQMSYTRLYDHASIRYVAKYLMSPAGYDYNYWRYGTFSSVHPNTKDTRMSNICTAAKNTGISIYTIGFEVSENNASKLRACASSPNAYFDVDDGDSLAEAFAAIAASLHNLSLIQ